MTIPGQFPTIPDHNTVRLVDSVYSVFSVDLFFTRKVTDGHGCPQADEEDIVYHRNLDGM